MKQRANEAGFTVIELIIFFVILVVLGAFFFVQKIDLESSMDDQARKVAVNSMYHGLKNVYHKEKGYYPSEINSEILNTVDPDLFFDPYGIKLGEEGGDYRYEGINCDNEGRCKDFRLSSIMEKEAEFVRTGSEK